MDIESYFFDSEEGQAEDINQELFEELLVWGTDWTIGTIYNLILKEKIDLTPRMQRRDVWNPKKKSKLIESVILNIPIPQIILAEKNDAKGQYMVIDGKQRLLSITQFLNSLNENTLKDFKQLKLKDLEVLSHLNNLTAKEIRDNGELQEYIDLFENQTIRTIIVKNWKDESVLFTIFNRLNTGTEPLSAQELRMTLYPGEFMEFVSNVEVEQIKKVLGVTGLDSRMRDVELLIRYFSFKLFPNEYNGKLRNFFDLTSKQLNKDWTNMERNVGLELDNLKKAIDLTYEIFEDNAFKKYQKLDSSYSRQFNKVAFDLLTYFLSIVKLQEVLDNDESKVDFKYCYQELFQDDRIIEGFDYHTTDLDKVQYRFERFAEILKEKFSLEFPLKFKESV